MNQIRALFTDECNGNGPTDCVENHAEGVIDDIAKAKPKTDSDFNDAFKEALSDNGADNKGGSLATTGDQSPIDAGSLPTPTANSGTIKDILEFVFGLIGAFAVLNITLSGLKYITSAGNEQRTSEAKNGIVYSLVGLAIAISAEAIVAFVVGRAST